MDMTASFPANAPDNAKGRNEAPPYVTFLEAMRPLTGKWKIEILWVLAQRTLRFGELRRALPGITQHMLSLRLRALAIACSKPASRSITARHSAIRT